MSPSTDLTLERQPVGSRIEGLVHAATERSLMQHTDSKSGATLESVLIDGERFVLKHLDIDNDWALRAVGDLRFSAVQVWAKGLLDAMPDCFAQPVVAAAVEDRRAALLMRDIGDHLVPAGDEPIRVEQHLGFIEHMAAMHACFWEAGAFIDLIAPMNRLLELSPWMALTERALGSDHVVPRLVGEGWDRLASVAPAMAAIVLPLAWDPSPLADALASTPSTLVHGNWKLGNLGSMPDGRTVLIDWENPGRGAGCGELGWYLAINSARLPVSKEATIQHYRGCLEKFGINTQSWWDRQMALGLLAGCVWFGWEKAFGGWGDELEWWSDRAREASDQLP